MQCFQFKEYFIGTSFETSKGQVIIRFWETAHLPLP